MRVAVIVPTYNEADNIVALCEAVRAALDTAEIIVIDDASPDRTAELVKRAGKRLGSITVIEREAKSGLGSAYRAGFEYAIGHGADVCVQIDADLSHDPADLPALVAQIEHGADLAIGSRYVPGGRTIDWPYLRRALSRWGNRYAAGMLGLAVNDATAGYRAYSVAALERMNYATVTADGYGFQIEMTHRLVRAGGKIVEWPIGFKDRAAGQSKLDRDIIDEAFVLVLRLWMEDLKGRHLRRRQGR